MELDYIYYDTAVFGTVANTTHVLFQTANGATSTANDAFTNMSGSGSFPQSEDFSIQWLGVAIDYNGVTADYQNTFYGNVFTIEVANKMLFRVPLFVLAYRSAYGGHYSQTAAADESAIGLAGDGYSLRKPIFIPKGTGFRVSILQATALSAANRNVKVLMGGIRTMP